MFLIALYLLFVDMGSWIALYLLITNTVTMTLSPMLPVSMVMGSSVAAQRLEHNGIHVLQSDRIPIAGKISTMVFDKTGTITKEGMSFSGALDVKDALFEEPVWLDAA